MKYLIAALAAFGCYVLAYNYGLRATMLGVSAAFWLGAAVFFFGLSLGGKGKK